MYNVEQKELDKMERLLYRHGLTGGCVITPIELENGLNVQKDVNYLYSNKDITVRFFRERNENGVWCKLYRIQFENYKTGKIITFNRKDK